jgi:formate hydrogenlyase subunit 6/NADH:ubiquinone oxidoreductase subunit I
MAHQGANNTYWGHIKEAFTTLLKGLQLSLAHLKAARKQRPPIYVSDSQYFKYDTGIVTLQYPKETLPVPDNGRYKLHNEIDDCIVCDKCAKICPVNCIEIEPIRAVEEIGKTSDGSSKRIYAAKFDIDMGKCCFCGLCTTVCPTECLTMTKDYDFSEYDVVDHNFSFSEMTPLEILEKQQTLEAYMQTKESAKTAKTSDTSGAEKSKPVIKPKTGGSGAKPVFRPKTATDSAKPVAQPKEGGKPVIKPKMGTAKPVIKPKLSSKPVIKRKEETPQDPQEMAKKIMEQKRAQQKKDDNTNQNSDNRE